MDMVKGRGRKVHMRSLHNNNTTACGVEWDNYVDRDIVDADEFCKNCMHTHVFKDAGGDKLFPPAPTEPPTGP